MFDNELIFYIYYLKSENSLSLTLKKMKLLFY